MAHFAKINEDKIVTEVVVCDDIQWLKDNIGGTWIQTSYNTFGGVHKLGGTPLRKNFAGIGFKYDEQLDAFIPPKPFKSWRLNPETCLWKPLFPYPKDGKSYHWDDNKMTWVK
jgi:hypothetical protein